MPSSSNPAFIVHNGASREKLGAFQAAALAYPSGMTEAVPVLPGRRMNARCRICGGYAVLTEEHIPPQSAYNKGRMADVAVLASFTSDVVDPPERGRIVQGGMRGYTLCEKCNNFTGARWVREYGVWVQHGGNRLGSRSKMDSLDQQPGIVVAKDVVFAEVYPARFVRQVIAMMMSLSGGPELGDRFPVLRDLALGGVRASLPAEIRFYLVLYGSQLVRAGSMRMGNVDTAAVWRVIQLDFAPFGLFAVVDGPPMDSVGHDISGFTENGVDDRVTFTVPELRVGFGHKSVPCDYRTAGQLLADRGGAS